MEDLELDADGNSNTSGSVQTVRKSISLHLNKKTKMKQKSIKTTKTKKERRDYRDDEKSRRSSKPSSERRGNSTEDDERDEELDWSHKIHFVGEKVQQPMIHICEKCLFPILRYGRLNPCKHVFCLSCAEKCNGTCYRCSDGIDRIESATVGNIFVCTFGGSINGVSGCRRSYLSHRDLIAHIKHRHEKEGSLQDTDLHLHQHEVHLPFFQTQLPHAAIVPANINLQNSNQTNNIGNAVMLAPMPSGNQQPIIVDVNRMPIMNASGLQALTPNLNLTQTPFQTPQFIASSRGQFQGLPNQLVNSPANIQTSNSEAQQRCSASNVSLSRMGQQQSGLNEWTSSQDWNQSNNSQGYQQQQYYK